MALVPPLAGGSIIVIAVVLALFAGWLGDELVYRLNMGVTRVRTSMRQIRCLGDRPVTP